MESSSTTINISGTVPLEVTNATVETPKHSHGPNFGRYVEGCAACVAKYPNGPVKKERKPKTDEIAALKAELAKAYSQAQPAKVSNDDATRQLAEIMLRREAKQAHKEEEAEARRLLAREQDLVAAKEQMVQKLAREAACESTGHRKENGRSALAASQVHNDGFLHPFCMRCFKTFSKRRPNHEEMSTSVQ